MCPSEKKIQLNILQLKLNWPRDRWRRWPWSRLSRPAQCGSGQPTTNQILRLHKPVVPLANCLLCMFWEMDAYLLTDARRKGARTRLNIEKKSLSKSPTGGGDEVPLPPCSVRPQPMSTHICTWVSCWPAPLSASSSDLSNLNATDTSSSFKSPAGWQATLFSWRFRNNRSSRRMEV